MKQLKMNFLNNYKKEFGGSLLIGKRKEARPLSNKHPIHLVIKSCHKGVFNPGNFSLEKLIKNQAKKFNIKVYDFAVNWSHIHLLIQLNNKNDYVKFIRSLTSILAQRIRQSAYCKKLSSTHTVLLGKVFSLRPYTRILTWGRQMKNVLNYQIINQLEAAGHIVRKSKRPIAQLRKAQNKCRKNSRQRGILDLSL